MSIPANQFRGEFTQGVIAIFKEQAIATSFLRSWFPSIEKSTRYLSLDATRTTETVADDVIRKTEGNRNTFSKSNEKVFDPPFYHEYFDLTDLDLYDRASTSTDAGLIQDALQDVAMKMGELRKKIERRYELQCSQALQTGIVTMVNGTNINFGRKAASIEDLSGATWATGTNDPLLHLMNGATFLRTKGKVQGGTMDVIMGDLAFNAFQNNTIVKARADIKSYSLDSLTTPQRNAVGGVLLGIVSSGSYNFRIWGYPEYYDLSGTSTPYIAQKKIVMLPQNPDFKLAFAAVPQLLGSAPKKGAYLVGEYTDERTTSHIMDIKSAGLATLVGVDQVYTATVLA